MNPAEERLHVRAARALGRLAPATAAVGNSGSPRFDTVGIRPTVSPQKILLAAMWVVIGLVAAYDSYLAIKYQHVLQFHELNPMGRWLIGIDDGSVALFVGCKFAGTVLSLGALVVLAMVHQRIAMAVTMVLASLQVILFGYLLFA